jgi:hypothetical protein
MILDLRLPPGWTQRHLVVPGEPIEAGAGLAGGAPADSAVAALPPALADLTSGWLIVPPIEEAEDRSFEPAALLLSPLLPLPRSPTVLLQAALESEPDYEVTSESHYLAVRLGAWEVTVLETTGQSRETGIESARLYTVLDAGYGAYMMVFIDCDAERIGLRRDQLVELISDAELRTQPRPLQLAPPASPASKEPELAPAAELLATGLPPLSELVAAAGESSADTDGTVAEQPSDLAPVGPTSAPLADGEPLTAPRPVASAPSSGIAQPSDPDALPLPPQRPAPDVYLKGSLYPHLVD